MEHYNLQSLPYGYKDLEPYMSAEVLTLHHDKHHAAYVNAANILIDKIQQARTGSTELDQKSALKGLSFAIGGHILHKLFWENMAPDNSDKNKLEGEILKAIEKEFGSFERFKTEFTETAKSVEGSGWAVLTKDMIIMQIEKHNVNLIPQQEIILVLDVWEHAYYLDYKNDRAKFIENWWNIINWQEVEKRFKS
ncbi:MAG: superoxide dismutase [Candidatus Staskawiczbacteria bacterium]